MKKLLSKIPLSVWFVLAAYVGTVGPKSYLEHFKQPVPAGLFLAALVSTLFACSVCLGYAVSFARGHFDPST